MYADEDLVGTDVIAAVDAFIARTAPLALIDIAHDPRTSWTCASCSDTFVGESYLLEPVTST